MLTAAIVGRVMREASGVLSDSSSAMGSSAGVAMLGCRVGDLKHARL